MSNYIQDCLNGDALISDINDYIDKWHDSIEDLPLHDFLGMSKKEYSLFVQDENYLAKIIAAHKFQKSIESLMENEISIAARSNNQAKSKALLQWLRSENLWE